MKTNLKKKEKGITLIALVITIIVLLILAAITLATLVGENGVLTKAEKSKVSQVHAQVIEAIKIEHHEYQISKQTQEKERQSTFVKFLIAKGYLSEEGIVNTVNLLGNKVALGNRNRNNRCL